MEPFNGIFHSRKDIHWRFSTILKASKKVYEVMFLICKVCISWKYIHYTIHWDKTSVKEIRSDKISGTKNALITVLFLICDSYMSWSTRFVSLKLCVGFSFFNSVPFLLKFRFLFKKMHGLFDYKTSWFLSKWK